MTKNNQVFVLLIFIFAPLLTWAAPSSPKIDEVITNFDEDELVIMGSNLSDGVSAPTVRLGGALLFVTDFDEISITADALLKSFVPGDYLLVVDSSSNGDKSVEILLTLSPPGDSVAGKSCDLSFECGNGIVENGAPLVGFADDASLICMYPEACDDGNTLNGDGCSATCTIESAPDLIVTKSAPEATNAFTITYTINYENPAASWVPAGNVVLTDAIPAGATYVNFSATGGGVFSAGVLTWNLPDLNPGDLGSVSFQVSVLSDGVYQNTAELAFSNGTDRVVSSNTTLTVHDTIPPDVTIIGPDGATTYTSTPSFEFFSSDISVTFECRVDLGIYAACASPYTTAPLSDGVHMVDVRATDPAGNVGTNTSTFEVIAQVCGNSIVEPPEECDDGNTNSLDGCSDICTIESAPDLIVTKSAPELTNALPITYTINFENPAASWVPAGNVVLTDAIPAGATYVNSSATGGGVFSAGVLTWNLPDLNPGDSGSVSFQVFVWDGAYQNTAELAFSNGTDRIVSSNTTLTVFDGSFPIVEIIGPDGATIDGATTYTSTPSFEFFSDDSSATFECGVDLYYSEPECVSPYTTAPLSDGIHRFDVRATDPAGNVWNYTRTFEVIAQVCGNSIVEPPEECDDGNVIDGDGCSSVCTIE